LDSSTSTYTSSVREAMSDRVGFRTSSCHGRFGPGNSSRVSRSRNGRCMAARGTHRDRTYRASVRMGGHVKKFFPFCAMAPARSVLRCPYCVRYNHVKGCIDLFERLQLPRSASSWRRWIPPPRSPRCECLPPGRSPAGKREPLLTRSCQPSRGDHGMLRLACAVSKSATTACSSAVLIRLQGSRFSAANGLSASVHQGRGIKKKKKKKKKITMLEIAFAFSRIDHGRR